MFIATVTSLVPQLFTAMFDPEQYQSLIDTNIPDLFTAFFIINSSATIKTHGSESRGQVKQLRTPQQQMTRPLHVRILQERTL